MLICELIGSGNNLAASGPSRPPAKLQSLHQGDLSRELSGGLWSKVPLGTSPESKSSLCWPFVAPLEQG